MDRIGIYREGVLPPLSHTFLKLNISVLRCSYWKIYYWQHDSLLAPYWRIYWNEREGAVISIDGENWSMDPCHFYLIPPNTPFSSHLVINTTRTEKNFVMGCPCGEEDFESSYNSMGHFFIHFSVGLPFDRMVGRIFPIALNKTTKSLLEDLKDSFKGKGHDFSPRSLFALKGLIHLLLLTIDDDLWPGEIADKRIRQVVSYMEKKYFQNLGNGELAAMVHLSENGFSRLFKKNTGKSPRNYLIDRRLDHACNLLHHSSCTIDEIASLCGFCDRSYFSRVFSMRYSVGPSRFRKNSFGSNE